MRVDNTGSAPIYYSLSVNGGSVSMLPGAAVASAPAMTTGSAAPAAPAVAAASGVNPETALTVDGNAFTLQPGATVWYGFKYAGDASQIQVILNAQGQTGLAFGVWTPDLIKQYEAGQAVEPIGRGSANVDVPGADLFWTGNFDLAATYFVRVDNTSGPRRLVSPWLSLAVVCSKCINL